MNKVNFDREMERTMEGLPRGTPLLLHACCAPCSSAALERLAGRFAITLYYYNPNIQPKEEHDRRLAAFDALLAGTSFPAELRAAPYAPKEFFKAARGLEQEPEGGARCRACIGLRLEKTAREAERLGFPYFGTTLTLGPQKDTALVNGIGDAHSKAGRRYLPADFKKRDGYRRSLALSRQYGLYRQNYCGCLYGAGSSI